MRLSNWLYSGCISVAMIVSAVPAVAASAPAVAAASEKCACVPGPPSAASNTWDFKGEASAIFKDVQFYAERSLSDADELQGDARAGLSWQSQAGQLDNLKDDINYVGVKLCRLETIRSAVAPWQQREIDRIAASTVLLADNAEDAIQFGNTNQLELWVPAYQNYVNNLYGEAHRLTQSVGQAVEFASVSQKYQKEVKSL